MRHIPILLFVITNFCTSFDSHLCMYLTETSFPFSAIAGNEYIPIVIENSENNAKSGKKAKIFADQDKDDKSNPLENVNLTEPLELVMKTTSNKQKIGDKTEEIFYFEKYFLFSYLFPKNNDTIAAKAGKIDEINNARSPVYMGVINYVIKSCALNFCDLIMYITEFFVFKDDPYDKNMDIDKTDVESAVNQQNKTNNRTFTNGDPFKNQFKYPTSLLGEKKNGLDELKNINIPRRSSSYDKGLKTNEVALHSHKGKDHIHREDFSEEIKVANDDVESHTLGVIIINTERESIVDNNEKEAERNNVNEAIKRIYEGMIPLTGSVVSTGCDNKALVECIGTQNKEKIPDAYFFQNFLTQFLIIFVFMIMLILITYIAVRKIFSMPFAKVISEKNVEEEKNKEVLKF